MRRLLLIRTLVQPAALLLALAAAVVYQTAGAQEAKPTADVAAAGESFTARGSGAHWLLALTAHEQVQQELGFSPELNEALSALRREYRTALASALAAVRPREENLRDNSPEAARQRASQYAAQRAEAIEKVNREFTERLKARLSPQQMERLQQIQLQEEGIWVLLTSPRVGRALALTGEQREQLRAVANEVLRQAREEEQGRAPTSPAAARSPTPPLEERLLAVLTDAQREQFAALKGPPMKLRVVPVGMRRPVGLDPRGPVGGSGSIRHLLNLARQEAVQKELRVTPEVAAQLTALSQELVAAEKEALQQEGIDISQRSRLSPEEQRQQAQKLLQVYGKLYAKLLPAYEGRLRGLLTNNQWQRLAQIRLQWQGIHALVMERDLATELDLSREQIKTIYDLLQQYSVQAQTLLTVGLPYDQAERMAQVRALVAEREAEVLKVLTEEQRVKFRFLSGEPFDLTPLEFELSVRPPMPR